MKRMLLSLCVWMGGTLLSLSAYASARNQGPDAETVSPNRKISLVYNGETKDGNAFGIRYRDCDMATVLTEGMLTDKSGGQKLNFVSASSPRRISEEYEMSAGKKRLCRNEGIERTFVFSDSLEREVKIVFRVYNDGVAFRYELDGLKNERIEKDLTVYNFGKDTKRWLQKYDISYEGFFPLDYGEATGHWAYPALFQKGNDAWMLVSEAGIGKEHSASSLKNEKYDGRYELALGENKKTFSGSWKSPWRMFIIGGLADVVESTLVTDLSEPARFDASGWAHPGCASWIYWAYNRGSKDFQIVKQYIDMAEALRLPYVLIDWEWDVMQNGGTVDDAIAYAKKKGVKVMLWYNSSTAWVTGGASGPLYRLNKPEDREREFAWLEEKGVVGVKIDFFAGDTQETMEYCIDLLECAAKHKLMVNFHGATLPRGWQRTYPNLMTTEAVYGAEWYNNNPRLTCRAASHNATLPFTRNVVGSMDYTPCTFTDSQNPHITTDGHELALTVLFESGLQHLADRPESYLSQPEAVRKFLTELPAAWDDTRLLCGYPGDYVVLARRKGDTWYVAGINGADYARKIAVDFSPLVADGKRAVMYTDAEGSTGGWNISDLTLKDVMEIECMPRGGFVLKTSVQ